MSPESDSKPLVSIVTPSYNQEAYIEDTLRSVMNQSYPNVEHIVTDGGSSDDTIEILEEYETKYNLRWVSEPDEGQSDAVNQGFEKADGDIVGWLNSDDVYFSKNAITSIVDTFESNPETDIVYGDDVFLDESGTIIRARKLYDWDYNRMLRWGWWGWTPASEATFYRSDVIDAEKLDDQLEYVLDYEYFLRLGKQYDFHHSEATIAGKRQHEQTKSSNRDEVEEEARRVLRDHGFEFDWLNRVRLFATLLRTQVQWMVSIPTLFEAMETELAFDGASMSRSDSIRRQLPKVPI